MLRVKRLELPFIDFRINWVRHRQRLKHSHSYSVFRTRTKMAEHSVFTLSQIAQHKSKKDCWLVIDGRVLNVTRFLEEHPGGEEVLLESAGKDATKEFKDIGHSKAAQNMLQKYQVGVLQGYSFKKDADAKVTSTDEPKTKKEMSAFAIKDDSVPKFAAFLEFFVPILVAGSYFTYRYLNAGSSMV